MTQRALTVFLLTAGTLLAQGLGGVKSFVTPSDETARQTALETKLRSIPSRRAAVVAGPAYALAALSQKEIAAVQPKEGTVLAGVHRPVPFDWMSTGEWVSLGSGRRFWRAGVESPGAVGIRLHFEDFDIGAGSLWIHGGEGAEAHVVGPYTGRGIHGDGEFWSEVIFAGRIHIEYEPAADAGEALPFRIDKVSHIWDSIVPKSAAPAAGLGLDAGSEPRGALSCNVDLTCRPQFLELAKSVARISFETAGGSALCSGSLLNTRNQSLIPYFLTANHCISNSAEARSVVALFNFQTSTCNGRAPAPNTLPQANGATLLVTGPREEGDFTLIRLNTIPAAAGVVFAGWNANDVPIGTPAVGIHHPDGDFKRISFGERIEHVPIRGVPEPLFYTIGWREGITEGGSSGSPLFNGDGQVIGNLSYGPRPPAGRTICDLIPTFDGYGRFQVYFPAIRSFLEDRAPSAPPPAASGNNLTSGQARNFTLPEVENATLFFGESGFRVTVPANASRMEIRLTTTRPANADVDLFVRYGEDVVLDQTGIVHDFRATGPTGNETIVLTPPQLRAGTYFIALALFTTRTPVEGNILVSITTGAPPPTTPPAQNVVTLTAGQARPFTIEPVPNSGTLVLPIYRIDVPRGANRMQIQMEVSTANVDVDLLARFNTPVDVQQGVAIYDHGGTTLSSNETVTVTLGSTPPLREGPYFVTLAVFTPSIRIQGTLRVTIDTGAVPVTAITLTSGLERRFTLPSVAQPTIFTGADQLFLINVPAGSARLEIRVRSNALIRFAARICQAPQLQGNTIVADNFSPTRSDDALLSITSASNAPLRAGPYYIAIVNETTFDRTIDGFVTASIVPGGTAQPPAGGCTAGGGTGDGTGGTGGGTAGTGTLITSGQQVRIQQGPVSGPTLFNGDLAYRILVPDNATRLRITLSNVSPANADFDLFASRAVVPSVVNGRVQSDFRSEGDTSNETIVIDNTTTPRLQGGLYYITVALFTTGVRAEVTLTATVEAPATPPPGGGGGGTTAPPVPTAPTTLTSGTTARFGLPSVTNPTLFNGNYAFRINVPEGASSLTIRLNTTTPSADVDLFVRHGADPVVQDGQLVADHSSETLTGNEVVVITPRSTPVLRSGVYHIALGLFTTGIVVQGTVTATVERAAAAPPPTGGTVLISGEPVQIRIPAVQGPTFIGGGGVFRIATTSPGRLEVKLTGDGDVDLFVRVNQPPALDNGRVVADFASTTDSDELILINNAPAATYYIAIAVITAGREVNATLTATSLPPTETDKSLTRRRPFGDKSGMEPAVVTKSGSQWALRPKQLALME